MRIKERIVMRLGEAVERLERILEEWELEEELESELQEVLWLLTEAELVATGRQEVRDA